MLPCVCSTMNATHGGHARAVRRTGALRKGMTLPPNLSSLLTEMPEAEDGGNRDHEVERRRAKGYSLTLANRSAVAYGNDDTQIDNDYHHSSDGDEDDDDDDSDMDDFTDDEDDDEIIYENPVRLNPI